MAGVVTPEGETRSVSRRREARPLESGETELVARSLRPGLDAEDDAGPGELIRLLRDRARDVARRQRREVRAEAAPSGNRPATNNAGTREKAALPAVAVKCVSRERECRRRPRPDRVRRPPRSGDEERGRRSGREPARDLQADAGMNPLPNESTEPSGALDNQG